VSCDASFLRILGFFYVKTVNLLTFIRVCDIIFFAKAKKWFSLKRKYFLRKNEKKLAFVLKKKTR